MSDIRYNSWLHTTGTGGVYQDSAGNVGIASTQPQTTLDIGKGEFQVGPAGIATVTTVNTTNLINATPLSHRNLLINGQFLIWQKATDSGSNTTDGFLSADRWFHASSGATKQVTRQTFALGQTDVPDNPRYYLRYAVTVGNNNVALRQRIEDVTTCQTQMTFSFWVKGTNPGGGTFDLQFRQNFGGGGSPSAVVDQSIGSYTVSNTWTKKTFTFTPTSISGKTLGTTENTSYYEIELFRQPAGDTSTAAFTVDFANAQLEYGAVATPFECRSYGDELSRCQRYFFNIKVDDNDSPGIFGYALSAGDLRVKVDFPVPMRTMPTYTGNAKDCKFKADNLSASFHWDDFDTINIQTTLNPRATILRHSNNLTMTAGQAGDMESHEDGGELQFDAEFPSTY